MINCFYKVQSTRLSRCIVKVKEKATRTQDNSIELEHDKCANEIENMNKMK